MYYSILLKLITCALTILFVVYYGDTHFYRDPGSVFFHANRAFERRYSRVRQEQVEQYIHELSTHDPPAQLGKEASSNAEICVAFSSVQRSTSQYLEVAVGSLVQGLTVEEQRDLHIAVLIAETDPERHSSWRRPWLRHVVDDVFTYNVSAEERARIESMERSKQFAEKGVLDYTTAMQRCHDTGAPYIAMFEDDILLADGWFVRTLLALRRIQAKGDNGEGPWLFMRLFNQERSTGWATRRVGGNHEHWIILGIAVAVIAPVLLARRRWRWARMYLDLEWAAVLVLVFIPAMVVLFFQSGKASLLPPAPGVVEEAFGCCSQALIFPRASTPTVVNFLRDKRAGQIDLLLDALAEETGLARYALYPVQAQHNGLDSSRGTQKNEAQSIWSMAFEDLDVTTQAKEHHEMVTDYYGLQRRLMVPGV